MVAYLYDPESELAYGYWKCPKCGRQFYGGGHALHMDTCPDFVTAWSVENVYENCLYIYTYKELTNSLYLTHRWDYAVDFYEFVNSARKDHPEVYKNANTEAIRQSNDAKI